MAVNMPTIEDNLWVLEQKLWVEGADFYAQQLTDDCVLLMPPPAGVLGKDAAIEWIKATPRWAGVRFGGRRVLKLHDRILVLAYSATAHRRKELGTHRALVSSVYVNRNGNWNLACHQQTLDEAFSGATGRFQVMKEP
jgi:hypothetical protein